MTFKLAISSLSMFLLLQQTQTPFKLIQAVNLTPAFPVFEGLSHYLFLIGPTLYAAPAPRHSSSLTFRV